MDFVGQSVLFCVCYMFCFLEVVPCYGIFCVSWTCAFLSSLDFKGIMYHNSLPSQSMNNYIMLGLKVYNM